MTNEKQPTGSARKKAEVDATAGAQMMVAERIYIISAPGGPRRRAGHAFGPEPREMRWEDFGDDPDAVMEALRADPRIKIDGRFEERPADPEEAPAE